MHSTAALKFFNGCSFQISCIQYQKNYIRINLRVELCSCFRIMMQRFRGSQPKCIFQSLTVCSDGSAQFAPKGRLSVCISFARQHKMNTHTMWVSQKDNEYLRHDRKEECQPDWHNGSLGTELRRIHQVSRNAISKISCVPSLLFRGRLLEEQTECI